MNEIKIKDINNVYNIMEIAENTGDEITVRLLNADVIIYHSDNLNMFKIDIVGKYELRPEYRNLCNISYKDFSYYVEVLCDYYIINYRTVED